MNPAVADAYCTYYFFFMLSSVAESALYIIIDRQNVSEGTPKQKVGKVWEGVGY